MLTLLAAWSFTTSRRLFQIGILLTGVGAGFVGLAGLGLLRPQPLSAPDAPTSRSRSSFAAPALIIAGVLMVGGLVLLILTVHYGVSPFSPRPK